MQTINIIVRVFAIVVSIYAVSQIIPELKRLRDVW